MSQVQTPQSEMLCVGVITNAHGIRGGVKIKAFNADPRDLGKFIPLLDEETQTPVEIERVLRVEGDRVVAHLKGIQDRNAAEALKGHKLVVSRESLPDLDDEDEFYHADLIGLPIKTEKGQTWAKVLGIYNFGAGDVLEVELCATQKSDFIPFTKKVIPTVTATHLTVHLDALASVTAGKGYSDE